LLYVDMINSALSVGSHTYTKKVKNKTKYKKMLGFRKVYNLLCILPRED
jgi:hypothetical protein